MAHDRNTWRAAVKRSWSDGNAAANRQTKQDKYWHTHIHTEDEPWLPVCSWYLTNYSNFSSGAMVSFPLMRHLILACWTVEVCSLARHVNCFVQRTNLSPVVQLSFSYPMLFNVANFHQNNSLEVLRHITFNTLRLTLTYFSSDNSKYRNCNT